MAVSRGHSCAVAVMALGRIRILSVDADAELEDSTC
jgi:hypothetical protein